MRTTNPTSRGKEVGATAGAAGVAMRTVSARGSPSRRSTRARDRSAHGRLHRPPEDEAAKRGDFRYRHGLATM